MEEEEKNDGEGKEKEAARESRRRIVVQDSDETGQREGIKIKEKHGLNFTKSFNSLSLVNMAK